MKKYQVKFSPESERELEEFYIHIAKDAPQNAINWYFAMRDRINDLDLSPARCPYADENEYHLYEVRNLIIGQYRVLFRIEDTTVQILHIKHGKMKRKPLN